MTVVLGLHDCYGIPRTHIEKIVCFLGILPMGAVALETDFAVGELHLGLHCDVTETPLRLGDGGRYEPKLDILFSHILLWHPVIAHRSLQFSVMSS